MKSCGQVEGILPLCHTQLVTQYIGNAEMLPSISKSPCMHNDGGPNLMQVTDKKWLLDKWWSYLSSRLLHCHQNIVICLTLCSVVEQQIDRWWTARLTVSPWLSKQSGKKHLGAWWLHNFTKTYMSKGAPVLHFSNRQKLYNSTVRSCWKIHYCKLLCSE